jgi:hypothetical protein
MNSTVNSPLFTPGLLCLLLLSSPSIADDNDTGEIVRQAGDKLMVAAMGNGEPRSIGSYSLHIYQQDRDRYITGHVAPRDGSLADAWMHDLDRDGNPEVMVWLRGAGSGGYGTLDVYTLDGATLQQVVISEPATDVMQGYQGHDSFTLSGNTLQRKFPRYNDGDSNAQPSGGTTTLLLDFEQRAWLPD